MQLTERTTTTLKRELKYLHERRLELDAAIGAIGHMLGIPSASVGRRRNTQKTSQSRRAILPSKRGASLKAEVLSTLQDGQHTSSEVARQLESLGVTVGGKTSLRERVSRELARLRREGFVRRNSHGKYAVVTKRPQARHIPTRSVDMPVERSSDGASMDDVKMTS